MKRIILMLAMLAAMLLPAAEQKKITDGTVYDQVRMKLANDPDIKGGALTVEVKNGAVTVQGRVDKERSRQKIDSVVKKVKGVTSVVNQVKVEP